MTTCERCHGFLVPAVLSDESANRVHAQRCVNCGAIVDDDIRMQQQRQHQIARLERMMQTTSHTVPVKQLIREKEEVV